MMMAETVFSAVFNILSIYVAFRMVKLIISRKDETIVAPVLVYFFVWSINWLVYYFVGNTILTTSSLVIGMLIATVLLYEGTIIRKIVAVFSAIALGMVSENIIWTLFGESSAFQVNAALGSLFASFFNMILIFILERCFKIKKSKHISAMSYINIFIIIAGSIVLGEILVELGSDDQTLVTLGLSVICLIDVGTYYIYDKVNEVYLQKLERKSIKQRIEMYENQLEIMEQSQKNIKSLNHDMKNHLMLISSYIDSKEYNKAQQYIGDINNYMTVSGQHIHTGNQEIDAIMNYMITKAENKGCKVETQIQIPNIGFMEKLDLNILLGNLLDNAIEALEKVEERYLHISMKYKQGVFVVRIQNSYDGTLYKQGEKYITRKQDTENHGIGLENVNEIIMKYNGKQVVEMTDSQFVITIMLYMEAVHD